MPVGGVQTVRGEFMRTRFVAACALALALLGLFNVNLSAQSVPKSISTAGTDAAMREQKNAWTVGIVGGLFTGTYMRLVNDMASALNDGDNLRILPIVSYGAAANLDDLLYLHGVDAAITQSDVFEYFRTVRKTANLDKRRAIHHPPADLRAAHPGARRRPQPAGSAWQEGQFRAGRHRREPHRHHRFSASRHRRETGA